MSAKTDKIHTVQEVVKDLSEICGNEMLGNLGQLMVDINVNSENDEIDIEDEASIENIWGTLDKVLKSEKVTKGIATGNKISLSVVNQYTDGHGIHLTLTKETMPVALKVIGLYL